MTRCCWSRFSGWDDGEMDYWKSGFQSGSGRAQKMISPGFTCTVRVLHSLCATNPLWTACCDRHGNRRAAATEIGEAVRIAVILCGRPECEVLAAGQDIHRAAALATHVDERLFGVGVPLDHDILVAHGLAGIDVDEPDDQPAGFCSSQRGRGAAPSGVRKGRRMHRQHERCAKGCLSPDVCFEHSGSSFPRSERVLS